MSISEGPDIIRTLNLSLKGNFIDNLDSGSEQANTKN